MGKLSEIIKEKIPPEAERAVFAGGCFWCLEANLQVVKGVIGVVNGYAGGPEFNPSYREVCDEQTGHREAVLVYYDPQIISYQELLDLFWQNIDPTDGGGQFFDRGLSYTTAVFYLDERQQKLAQASLDRLRRQKKFDKPIVTQILPYTTFYQAEDYHQDFFKHYPQRYKSYTKASGREEFKKLVWQTIVESSTKSEKISAALAAIRRKTDELGRPNLKRTGLASIHGGGSSHEPKLALVFMNPTQRNISSHPGWKGPRFPFIGTSRIWRLFGDCRLLDRQTAAQFADKPTDNWTAADARELERRLAQTSLYITNVVKETAVDSQPPKAAVFRQYQTLLHDEMEAVNPHLIIAFGLAAYKSLTGATVALAEFYEEALKSGRLSPLGACRGRPVIPCYFPIGRGNPRRATTLLRMITENKIARQAGTP